MRDRRDENLNRSKNIETLGGRDQDRRGLQTQQRSSTKRDNQRDTERRKSELLPSRRRDSPQGDHRSASRNSFLINALRRIRALEGKSRATMRRTLYKREKEELQSTLDRINGNPSVLEQVRSDFPPSRNDEHHPNLPVTVEGQTSPTVSRTTFWLRPDATFGLVHPELDTLTGPKELNLRSTIRRLALLIGLIQGREQSGEGPKSETLREALDCVERIQIGLGNGEWSRVRMMQRINKHMGEVGKLWNLSRPIGAPTYLYVGNGGEQLDLIQYAPPGANKSSPESKPLGESGQTQSTAKRNKEDDVPVSLPYSTAASEFLYGYNTVIAALRAQRRKLYHLYLHPRAMTRDVDAKALGTLAKQLSLPTTDNANLRLLDKMSEDRPHNGVVLEASRLPAPPLLSLASPNLRTSVIPLVLDRQNAEDVAVNGAPGALPTLTKTWRHPFVLMLDGIVDPGNVGNILRTAHFYGVDAVVLSTNTCAPLTSAALAKASSGACEALRIFALPKPSHFVLNSAKAGWHVYAAVAPQSGSPTELRRPEDFARNVTTSSVAQSSPLTKNPAILMLGAEGEGLRDNLVKRADHYISIEQGKRAADDENGGDVGVDSLNVSTAAGVLIEAFMRKPQGAKDLGRVGDLGF